MVHDVASDPRSGMGMARGPSRRDQITPLVGRTLVVVAIVVVAIAVRVSMFSYQSMDYVGPLKSWYDFIASHGGFLALRYHFSDYNVPYLYLLAALTYLPIPALAGIKIISVSFDLVLALFVFRIVKLRDDGPWLPALAAVIVLFLPTVATNSGLWGQCDSIYAAFAVGGVFYVLRQRPWLACTFFGLALAMKLQAVFAFPLLLVLVLRKRLPWRALLAVPAVYLALDVPAVALGAPVRQLLTVYVTQTDQYQQLTLNAPSVYQFLPSGVDDHAFHAAGILFTGVLMLALIGAVVFSRVELTNTRIILVATASVIVVPFFLPSMHERYFYLADVLTVIAACYLPRRLWYLPILVQAASFLSYLQVLSTTSMTGGIGMKRPPSDGHVGAPPQWDPSMAPPRVGGPIGQPPPGGPHAHFGPATGSSSPTEFKYLTALMALAVVSVLWFAFREFRRARGSGQREEHAEGGAARGGAA